MALKSTLHSSVLHGHEHRDRDQLVYERTEDHMRGFVGCARLFNSVSCYWFIPLSTAVPPGLCYAMNLAILDIHLVNISSNLIVIERVQNDFSGTT